MSQLLRVQTDLIEEQSSSPAPPPRRFTCPVQIGNSYRSSYIRARGRRCFDHNHYSLHNQDLRFAGIGQGGLPRDVSRAGSGSRGPASIQ